MKIKKILLRTAALGLIFAGLCDFFFDGRFFFQKAPVSLGWASIILLVLIPAALIYPYFRNLKVVLYRIVLKSFLNRSSLLFRALNRALVVKLLAFMVSFAVCAGIFIFFVTMKASVDKLFCIALMSLAFVILYAPPKSGVLGGIMAEDISAVLGQIAFPFVFAWATGILTVAAELNPQLIPDALTALFSGVPEALSLDDVFDMAPAIVGPEHIEPRIPRIVIRHVYLQELAVKSLLHPEAGKAGKYVFAFITVFKDSLTYLLGIFFLEKRLCDACDRLMDKGEEA